MLVVECDVIVDNNMVINIFDYIAFYYNLFMMSRTTIYSHVRSHNMLLSFNQLIVMRIVYHPWNDQAN